MPDLETMDLHDTAVVWPFAGYGDDGNAVVDEPYETDVRWVGKRREVLDRYGNTVAVDATAVMDHEVAVESAMWLGELDCLPDPPVEVMVVKAVDVTSDIKGRASRFEAMLMRYKDVPPRRAT